MFESGVISARQKLEIFAAVNKATFFDFRPLIYVVPYPLVAGQVEDVPTKEKAHPLSKEYRIERLQRECFDIIDVLGAVKYL